MNISILLTHAGAPIDPVARAQVEQLYRWPGKLAHIESRLKCS